MDESLYVRDRGKVLGPFPADKMRTLIQQRRLGRHVEVSPDGVSWEAITDRPELLRVETPVRVQTPVQHEKTEKQEHVNAVPQSDVEKWYFAIDNHEAGPVPISKLEALVVQGRLRSDDLVWTDGMPEWIRVSQVPQLNHLLASEQVGERRPRGREGRKPSIAPDILQPLSASQGWLIFLGVVAMIWVGLGVTLGVVLMVGGGRSESPVTIVIGLLAHAFALLTTVRAIWFFWQVTRISRVIRTRKHDDLVKVLQGLRQFWLFIGVIWIAILSACLVTYMIMLATGAALPTDMFSL